MIRNEPSDFIVVQLMFIGGEQFSYRIPKVEWEDLKENFKIGTPCYKLHDYTSRVGVRAIYVNLSTVATLTPL